jgi:RNA polymerase sigma-70 factor (ECF subfamily)
MGADLCLDKPTPADIYHVRSATLPAVSIVGGAPRTTFPSADDEAVLLARLQAGDELALATLYQQLGGYVYGLVRRVTGSDSAAEDITQDVFTKLWLEPHRVDLGRGTIRAFLGVTSHRRSVDWVRSETRRDQRELRSGSAPPTTADVADEATDRVRAQRVRVALAALPDSQREAVELAYLGGLSYREVADHLGIPEGTAKSRLRLALRRLGDALSSEEVVR